MSDLTVTPTPSANADNTSTGKESLSPALAHIESAFESLVSALTSATDGATSATDAEHDATLRALRKMRQTPAIVAAIAATEVERDADRANARDAMRASIRNQFADAFALMTRYGTPPAPMPSAKQPRAPKNANGDSTIRDADGNAYLKHNTPIRSYAVTGAASCGACGVSKQIKNAPNMNRVGNFRQNILGEIEKMTRADIVKHAACFASMSDTEATVYGDQVNVVRSFVLADAPSA